MAQFKIKQVRELQSTLDSITGIDTITEAYTTTATDGPTGITITYSCRETDNAQVYVNGVRINYGDFGWREGTTDVSSNSELNAGTELVWDSSAIGFDLANDDEVEIIYETGIPVSTGGSVGTGASGTSGTSGVDGADGTSGTSGVDGNDGTSGTSGVDGADGTSGTSGITNSNATGLTLTSPSGVIYVVGVDDAGNLTTTNSGTAGTSGSSSGSSTGPGGLTGTTIRVLGAVDKMNTWSTTDPFDSLGQTETYSNTYDWIIRNIDPVNIPGISQVVLLSGTVDSPWIWSDSTVGEDSLPVIGDTIYRDQDGANYFAPGGFLWYDQPNGDKNEISDYAWVTVGTNGAVTAVDVLQYPTPSITSTNLIAHLDASDSNSYPGTGTTWTDLTGNGHNGTLNGFTFNPGVAGGSFEQIIDGNYGENITFSQTVTKNALNLATNKNLTLQIWIYKPSIEAFKIFDKSTGTTGFDSVINNNNTISTYIDNSGIGPYGMGVQADNWNLITLQLIESVVRTNDPNVTNTGFRYYINDSVHMNANYPAFDYYNTNAPAGSWSSDTSDLVLSSLSPTVETTFKIGALYIYDRIITAQEVADNFNATKSRFGL